MSERLRNIKTYKVPGSVFFTPGMYMCLYQQAQELVLSYRAGVAKRTGQLAASADASVAVGGKRYDRLVGKVTIGAGTEYGVLHEFGAEDHHTYAELSKAAAKYKAARGIKSNGQLNLD